MFLLMSVQYSVEISRLDEKTRTLAEQLGILRTQLERHTSIPLENGDELVDEAEVDNADA